MTEPFQPPIDPEKALEVIDPEQARRAVAETLKFVSAVQQALWPPLPLNPSVTAKEKRARYVEVVRHLQRFMYAMNGPEGCSYEIGWLAAALSDLDRGLVFDFLAKEPSPNRPRTDSVTVFGRALVCMALETVKAAEPSFGAAAERFAKQYPALSHLARGES